MKFTIQGASMGTIVNGTWSVAQSGFLAIGAKVTRKNRRRHGLHPVSDKPGPALDTS